MCSCCSLFSGLRVPSRLASMHQDFIACAPTADCVPIAACVEEEEKIWHQFLRNIIQRMDNVWYHLALLQYIWNLVAILLLDICFFLPTNRGGFCPRNLKFLLHDLRVYLKHANLMFRTQYLILFMQIEFRNNFCPKLFPNNKIFRDSDSEYQSNFKLLTRSCGQLLML